MIDAGAEFQALSTWASSVQPTPPYLGIQRRHVSKRPELEARRVVAAQVGLKAKFESCSSHSSFKRLVPGALIGSTWV